MINPDDYEQIVFFTGAGMSPLSHIYDKNIREPASEALSNLFPKKAPI